MRIINKEELKDDKFAQQVLDLFYSMGIFMEHSVKTGQPSIPRMDDFVRKIEQNFTWPNN